MYLYIQYLPNCMKPVMFIDVRMDCIYKFITCIEDTVVLKCKHT